VKRITVVAVVALVAGLMFVGGAKLRADQPHCDVLDPTVLFNVGTGECEVSTALTKNGTFTIAHPLHILGGGKITTNLVGGITLIITGDLIIDTPTGATGTNGISGNGATSGTGPGRPITVNATGNILLHGDGTKGASITANQTSGDCSVAKAGNITLTSGGNFTTEAVSVISADAHCSAGAIVIVAGDSNGDLIVDGIGAVNIDGLVSSQSTLSGTGSTQAPGGGTITVKAGCALTIGDHGHLVSKGNDPGADLVHLEGCTVLIDGLVESISPGAGHALPNSPANHCNADLTAHPVGGATAFTACVEVWADSITIDSTGSHNGEVSADGIRAPMRAWIDLYAQHDIIILGDITGAYGVHANAASSGPASNSFGGLITMKSKAGKFSASGLSDQANATAIGSDGGDVIVEAGGVGSAGNVDFGAASIQAKESLTSSNTKGGHISARSFNGFVLGLVGGELNAGGGIVAGSVTLQGCGTVAPADGVSYAGTSTPSATILADACTGSPTIPTSVILPNCLETCFPSTTTTSTSTTTTTETTTTTTEPTTTTTTNVQVTTTTSTTSTSTSTTSTSTSTTSTTAPPTTTTTLLNETTTTTTTAPTTTTTLLNETTTTTTTAPTTTTTLLGLTTTTTTLLQQTTTTNPPSIPTANNWGMLALGLAFMGAMAWMLRVQRTLR
jgi:hypothetical protein